MVSIRLELAGPVSVGSMELLRLFHILGMASRQVAEYKTYNRRLKIYYQELIIITTYMIYSKVSTTTNSYHKRIIFVRNLLVFGYTIWRCCFDWEVFVSIKRSIGHFGRIRGSRCDFICCSSVSCRCCVCCCCVCCCCICCCRCCVFDGCIHRGLIRWKSVSS